MRLKFIVKITEKLLGTAIKDGEPRADMYLPERLLAMSFVFLAGGIGCAVYAFVMLATWAIVAAVIGILLGAFAFICWKNQSIHIISDEQFTYTTMFGNTRTYYFFEIRELRRNQDSYTLFVGNDKVHIESMAVLSDRLTERINKELEKRR